MIDDRTATYGALVLRLSLGVAALAHLMKLLVFSPARTVGFFASLGYPAALAWAVMLIETLGGVALILGFYARLVALIQIPILLGAMLVHLPRMDVRQREWWLGVPSVLDGGFAGAGPDRPGCARRARHRRCGLAAPGLIGPMPQSAPP